MITLDTIVPLLENKTEVVLSSDTDVTGRRTFNVALILTDDHAAGFVLADGDGATLDEAFGNMRTRLGR